MMEPLTSRLVTMLNESVMNKIETFKFITAAFSSQKTEHSEKWRMFRGCQCLQHLMQGYSMSKLRTQIMLMRSIFFNT